MTSKNLLLSALAFSLALGISGCEDTPDDGTDTGIKAQLKANLGEKLYSDPNLSADRTMSCATCHSLDHAMIDPRETSMRLGGSLGNDNVSIGDRNAPTAAYAMFSPDFHFDADESLYIGGQFLDGREKDLKGQAKGPFLNPGEMNMADASAVVERVKESSLYTLELVAIYGADILTDDELAYDAIADSIASFEKTAQFAPFDSKYDQFLAGQAELSPQEREGLALFEGKAQCIACHPSSSEEDSHPLFTDFSYDNLGVPVNNALRAANGIANSDLGLGSVVDESDLEGAFKVSSLRNIAVTGPYMHNGVFKDLKTVVHFYNTRDTGGINPETNQVWQSGEVDANKNVNELGDLGLSDAEEDAIVAFLKTLTDKKFESLNP